MHARGEGADRCGCSERGLDSGGTLKVKPVGPQMDKGWQ